MSIATYQRLKGQVAIVTGSDSGIGQATAIEFAKEGAHVVITYFKDEQGAAKTRQAVEQAGGKTIVVQLDQRDPANVKKLFDETESKLGTPTILVNNAGIDSTGKPVKELSDLEWDDRLKTNLYGPFYACRQFIKRIEGKGKHGSIINITSVHQEIPRAG